MISFYCMKKIENERPKIIETRKDREYTLEYSDYCFVKNKCGYLVARYVRCKEQNLEYWDDYPSTHPLNENDEWHSLTENPIFSFHMQLIRDTVL